MKKKHAVKYLKHLTIRYAEEAASKVSKEGRLIRVRMQSELRQHCGLCGDCQSSLVLRDDSGRVIVRCRKLEGDPVMHKKVVECTGFKRYGEQSYYDLKQMAWVVRTDNKAKPIGFISPRTEEHKKWLDKEDGHDPFDPD